jgi:hypothetical protein
MADRTLGKIDEGSNPLKSPVFTTARGTEQKSSGPAKLESKEPSVWTEAPFWEVHDFRGLTSLPPTGVPLRRLPVHGDDVTPCDEDDDFVVAPPRYQPELSVRPGGSLYAPPTAPRPNMDACVARVLRADSSWTPGLAYRSAGGYSWPTTWVD